MSNNHKLQANISGPRASSSDRRIAKTSELARSIGSDGKLYTKVQEEDQIKYRILDSEGLKVEERRASELKRSIQLTTGHGKNAADGLAKSNTVGSASQKIKLSARAAEFDHSSGAESKVIEKVHKGDFGISQADAKLADSKVSGNTYKASSGSLSPSKVKISTKTMTLSPQSKAYERNLEGIAAEMKASEIAEAKLSSRSAEGFRATTQDGSKIVTTPKPSSSEPNSARNSDVKPKVANPNSKRVDQLDFRTGELVHIWSSLAYAARSLEISPQTIRDCIQGRTESAAGFKWRESKHKDLTKEEAVQLHELLQKKADVDKDDYLKKQQERFHRASLNGKEFTAMMRRAEACHEKNEAKLAAKRAAEEKKAREEQEERDRKRREHLTKEINPASALSWREIQEAQEIARREAAEKRKQELASMSKAPSGGAANTADADKRMRDAARIAEYEAAHSFKFKAEDPEKVAEKLAKQNAAWERRLEEERERVRQRLAERLLNAAGKPTKSPVAAMEARANSAAARRAARQSEREERERKEAAKKAAVEKKKLERLYNTKIPEEGRKLTKSAMNRAHMVRAQFEKEKADKEREEKQKAEAKAHEREMSRILARQIAETERERREAMKSGYHELSEAELEQNRIAAKKEFQRRLKENQQRLAEVLRDRPSLLQRHEQTLAAKQAANSALKKVAKAMGADKKVNTSGYSENFEFFTQEEAMKLTATASSS